MIKAISTYFPALTREEKERKEQKDKQDSRALTEMHTQIASEITIAVNDVIIIDDYDVEQFFEIEVIRQDDTGNASSEDESDSESSFEAVVVKPKRQKKANTMIGDISKGKYSRS